METKAYSRGNLSLLPVGFGVGIIIALCLFSYRAFRDGRNLMDGFKAVRLGMPSEEAQQILHAANVQCNWQAPAGNEPAVCIFSDYTHEYRIVMSTADRKIIRKSFNFKIPRFIN